MKSLLLGLASLVACSRPNPEVCCITEEDCTSIGVTGELRECDPGLACVDHACVVPSCSTDGCGATAPVCDISTDVCTGCTESTECSRFADTVVCDPASGACVECVASSDCAPTAPVCDGKVCRTCSLDTECASGACGDDGACIDQSNIIYLAANGVDSGTCLQATPCHLIKYALSQTSNSRNHIVMANGTYAADIQQEQILISTIETPAAEIFIHGGSSTLNVLNGDGQAMLNISVPTTIRDLNIDFPTGRAVALTATTLLERVSLRAQVGLDVNGDATLHDAIVESVSTAGIRVMGSLTFDRGTVIGGTNGIIANGGTVHLTNVLVHGASKEGVDLTGGSGASSLEFVTITRTGALSTNAGGLACFNVAIRSSIVWTPTSTRPATTTGCTFAATTIAGPVGVTGALNMDPQFVDDANNDFHLSATSPARDAVNEGPALDFERQARPQGLRFDLGADEAL